MVLTTMNSIRNSQMEKKVAHKVNINLAESEIGAYEEDNLNSSTGLTIM